MHMILMSDRKCWWTMKGGGEKGERFAYWEIPPWSEWRRAGRKFSRVLVSARTSRALWTSTACLRKNLELDRWDWFSYTCGSQSLAECLGRGWLKMLGLSVDGLCILREGDLSDSIPRLPQVTHKNNQDHASFSFVMVSIVLQSSYGCIIILNTRPEERQRETWQWIFL